MQYSTRISRAEVEGDNLALRAIELTSFQQGLAGSPLGISSTLMAYGYGETQRKLATKRRPSAALDVSDHSSGLDIALAAGATITTGASW